LIVIKYKRCLHPTREARSADRLREAAQAVSPCCRATKLNARDLCMITFEAIFAVT
jgi:hypothetical protein